MSEPPALRIIDHIPSVRPHDVISPGAVARYLFAGFLVIILASIFAFWMLAVQVHINIWWFESLGLGHVYGRMWATEKSLFLLFTIITYLFLTLIFFATRAGTFRPGPDDRVRGIDTLLTFGVGATAMVVALLVGASMASEWQLALLAGHVQHFGSADPIHHRDIGFYVFTLPWREAVGNVVLGILVVGALELAGLAFVYTVTSPFETQRTDVRRVISVGCLFAAVLFGYLAWRNFFLNPYELTQPGTAFGGGATFVHSALWWYPIVGTVEIVAGLVLLLNTVLRRTGLLWIAAAPIIVGLAATVGQGIFQHFVVAPNELSAEYRYLGYTLHFTRQAYGMDRWRVREYTPRTLSGADLTRDNATVQDARIADLGAFTQVMRQRQENRTYYTFNQADIDRYIVNGQVRQVALATREMATWKLPGQAQTWVNLHLKFTHGYGLTMAPANTVTSDGQPVLWIQNVPVQEAKSGLPRVQEPRVYFGESTNDWILTGASTPEFDSSTADRDTSYRYTGPDGVPLGSGTKRLSITWAIEGGFPFFDKLNISGYVRPTTRILLHRNILDRVQTIAPWLEIDSDPYLVLRANGSLVWMIDGMTHTDHYPYSDPTAGDNYRRNSVKIVLDAYTGRPTFYAYDAGDPILRAWSAVFPGLLHPFSQMPTDLVAHIKYPNDYLSWQAGAYQRYHVTDVTSYYNGDNEWDVESANTYAWDTAQAQQAQLTPIWTVARLFGETRDSFYSILPFSVRGKATMAGYLAADNNTYQVTALDMPRGAQTMGATQFESLYNQAPTISSQLTLLSQHGSQVVPGQILILPVGRSLLYIEPLYLRSESQQSLPQLIRVVVGTQNEVNWGNRLQSAINRLLTLGDISSVNTPSGTATLPSPTPPVLPAPSRYTSLSDQKLIDLAAQYYAAAQRTSSLTEKDRDLHQLGLILQVLRARHKG